MENSFPLDWIHYVDSAGAFQQASDASPWWHFTNAATHLISEQHGAIHKSTERLMRTSQQLQTSTPFVAWCCYLLPLIYINRWCGRWEKLWNDDRADEQWRPRSNCDTPTSFFLLLHPTETMLIGDSFSEKNSSFKRLCIFNIQNKVLRPPATYHPIHLACLVEPRTAAAKNLRWFRSPLSDLGTIACCPLLENDLILQTFPQ